MDLGAPEAVLGFNCVVCVCVCISIILTISCTKNYTNVRGANSFEVKTIEICSSISGVEKQ